MSGLSIFDISGGGMRSQMMRLNSTASNIANAGTISGSEASAYRTIKPVFRTVEDGQGNATVEVVSFERNRSPPVRRQDPNHPLADAEGYVWEADVDTAIELVEMIEASRQFQNNVNVLETGKMLINETIRT